MNPILAFIAHLLIVAAAVAASVDTVVRPKDESGWKTDRDSFDTAPEGTESVVWYSEPFGRDSCPRFLHHFRRAGGWECEEVTLSNDWCFKWDGMPCDYCDEYCSSVLLTVKKIGGRWVIQAVHECETGEMVGPSWWRR